MVYNGDMINELFGERKKDCRKFVLLIEIDMNDSEQKRFMENIRHYKIININDHVKELLIKKVD
jgi:hypothetical protein